MPMMFVVGYFLLKFLIFIFTKNCHMPNFSVILENFMGFELPEVGGVRLLETVLVNYVRGVRLLESVRLLERIRYIPRDLSFEPFEKAFPRSLSINQSINQWFISYFSIHLQLCNELFNKLITET